MPQKPAKLYRKNDRESTVAARHHELPNDRSDDPISYPRREHSRPLAHSLPRAANGATGPSVGAAKKRKSEPLVHEGNGFTPSSRAKQTKVPARSKPNGADVSTDVRQRPPTSTDRLIDRIDIAIERSGIKGAQLAHLIGIKPQGFTNMRRKPNAGMHHGLLAKLAQVLGCDLYWLCCGGSDYVPANPRAGLARLSRLSLEIAGWAEALSEDDQLRAWAVMAQIHQGHWPTFRVADEPDSHGK